jgi:hypothetical protein
MWTTFAQAPQTLSSVPTPTNMQRLANTGVCFLELDTGLPDGIFSYQIPNFGMFSNGKYWYIY